MTSNSIEPIYGDTPLTWSMVTLGHLIDNRLAELQTGPFGTTLHASSYRSTGTPVVAVKHIENNRLKHDDLPRIDDETVQRLSRYRLLENDILYGRKGSVDRRALIKAEEAGWLQGSDCIRLRFLDDKIFARYISYVLGTSAYKDWVLRHAGGATMPSLNQEILRLIPLPLPPLPEQYAIARILGALDDKIELNRRMNRTLEAMAQALFKSWFVDFDPVMAKSEGRVPFGMSAETAALFPVELVEIDSEHFPLVPKGWKIGKVGDIGENVRRGILPDQIDPEMPYIGLEHMPRKNIALSEWGGAGDVTSNKFLFKKGEILFGKLRPYFHKVGVAAIDGVCSTDILIVNPKDPEYFGVLLGHLTSVDFINYVDAGSEGTKMPRTNWEMMARYPVANS